LTGDRSGPALTLPRSCQTWPRPRPVLR